MKVESFTLDHNKVVAPYVRKAEVIHGPKGDIVEKYDLRFLQPNAQVLPTSAVHTLEHLLAVGMRNKVEGIIDLSPMGCRTGFYLTVLGEKTVGEIQEALTSVLEEILTADTIPALSARECGNYRDHSLFSAKEYAKFVLEGFKREG
jgi:S-ribosylhomocysteine lyase